MIFTTENFLKDNGDKIPADQKSGIESALQQLRDAHKSADVAAIDTAINNLNTVMQAASQQMYSKQAVSRQVLSQVQTLVSRSSQSRMTPSKMQTLRK